MKKIWLITGLAIVLFPAFIFSQKTLLGIVTNEKEELLIGATVFWKSSQIGTVTDTSGKFSLPHPEKLDTLVVRYVGYTPVQVQVLPDETKIWVEISGITQLSEVNISDRKFDNATSLLDSRNVESINRKELRKAPCCNLSESFETTGAVDVVYSNALTGVKEIQMLGLRGVYAQFLMENRPTMGGIATPFAFEMIPGTWLSGISLAKGASTVKNGFSGITGQINVELEKPQTAKPLFINAFGSTEGRGELNLHFNKKGKNGFSNGLLLHGSQVKNQWDMNHDNFYDAPNRHQLNGLYRLTFESKDWCGQINVQGVTDRRTGGQIGKHHDKLFGVDQQNDRVEVWGKLGREGIGGKPYQQIGNIVSASWHRANSVFGQNIYQAEQKSVYWQTLFETIFGTTDHKIVVAPNLQFDDFQEKVNDGILDRRDFQPGAMAEYTFSRPNLKMGIPDLVVVAGARVDWHNRFGWFFTPRISAKYSFSENTTARVSAGRGFRVPNLMAENLSLLASNREMIFENNLGAEEAWNYGLNLTRNFKIKGKPGNFSVDLYRTDFIRQVLVDVEKIYNAVYFYNLKGKSFSNSALAMVQYNFFKGFDAKIAWKINDVKATFSGGHLKSVPLVAKHRGVVTLEYNTPGKKWMFNTITQIVGAQRLPDHSQIPAQILGDFPQISPTYFLQNAQITRRWHKTEVYVGGENLNNFHQHPAIFSAEDPTSPFFNASQIWAPTMGTVIYIGVRFSPSGVAE